MYKTRGQTSMTLNNIKRNKQGGFTIVELLIVIVVIAILAAITIVAYNGIQNRAKTTAGQELANQIATKAGAYNTLNSTYPNYCQLTTNTTNATGTGTTADPCVAGSPTGSGGAEAKLDNPSQVFYVSGAAADVNAATKYNSNKQVGYWVCNSNKGALVYYWDFAASTPIQATKSVGDTTGCTLT